MSDVNNFLNIAGNKAPTLEILGVRVEKTSEFGDIVLIWISVPEAYEASDGVRYTSDDISKTVKETILSMLDDYFDVAVEDKREAEDVKAFSKDAIKVFSKVRAGEIVTPAIAEQRFKELSEWKEG